MRYIIRAITLDKNIVLINEDQVATIKQGLPINTQHSCANIKMSNGDEFIVVEPHWDMWENDLFLKR
jgi:hypothetical protein